MTRALVIGLVLLASACGSKSFESLCATQVPAPAGCNTPCDPSPAAINSCPSGYHCSADGKCDLVCTASGNECGNGYSCTTDGFCQGGGTTGDPPIDSSCPAVHFAAMPTTPSVQLLIDRSGSMLHNFADQTRQNGQPEKYQTVQDALVGTTGVVTTLQAKVYFGATLFSADPQAVCPTLKTVGRTLNNKTAIETLISSNRPNPMANTPTPPSIDSVVADFTAAATKPPAGSPPVIVLATDGLPNECGSTNSTTSQSVAAAKNAFSKGIRLFILGVGTVQAQHLQDMANAGQGVQPGQPDAKAYTATDPTQIAAAFQEIIAGVVSCDLTLNGHVDPNNASSGTVSLNGTLLTFGTDWKLDADGIHIHLLGNACNTLKGSTNPVVDASFSCGAVIL